MITIYILSALGILSLLGEVFNFRKALAPIVLIGLAVGLWFSLSNTGESSYHFSKMLYFDKFTHAFSALLCLIGLIWVAVFQEDLSKDAYGSEKFSLILFSMVGGVFMLSFNHMVMLFLGIEILSIPLYVLAASKHDDKSSIEAGLKYFVLGSFAAGFLLLGIVLIYGVTGTFYIDTLKASISNVNTSALSSIFPLGILLTIIGFYFKVSIVPFHIWTPDVYIGSPTKYTAFMSSAVKVVGLASFFKFLSSTISYSHGDQTWILVIGCILSILIGNLMAVGSESAKRLLAYSSIAQAGYLLIALFLPSDQSQHILFYGLIAYSIASLTLFISVFILEKNYQTDKIESFSGLATTNPLLALCICISLLSLAGIPPLAGFFSKYMIFSEAISHGYLWLVIIAVVGSLVGVYYYFKIINVMYFHSGSTVKINTPKIVLIILTILALFSIIFGIVPDFLLKF